MQAGQPGVLKLLWTHEGREEDLGGFPAPVSGGCEEAGSKTSISKHSVSCCLRKTGKEEMGVCSVYTLRPMMREQEGVRVQGLTLSV